VATKVTLKDIAREADVSVGFASKALSGYADVSESTQERIRQISKRLGYRPPGSRQSTQRRSASSPSQLRRACLIFLESRNSGSAYAKHWVREFSLAARRQDIRLEVIAIESDEDDPLRGEELRRYADDVDGLLVFGFIEAWIGDVIQAVDKPCVAIGDFGHGSKPVAHQVNIDKCEMARTATRALLDAGHRRIGFFAPASQPGSWSDQWRIGYQLALIEAGITVDPVLRPLFDLTDRSALGARAAAHMAAVTPRPDAYVVPETPLAAHFRHAMAGHGINVEPHQMVIGGDSEVVGQFGLNDYPFFSEDVASSVVHALDLLRRLAQSKSVPPVQVMIPCQSQNLGRLVRKEQQ